MVDVAMTLDSLVPAARYGGSLTENTQRAYDALRWGDGRPKPTWSAILAEWPTVEAAINEADRLDAIDDYIGERWTHGQLAQAVADNDDGNTTDMTRLKADIADARAANP